VLTIGSRLKLERVRKSVSQAELARRTGIAQANISKIECGKQDLLVSTLLQICSALATPPSRVFEAAPARTNRFSRKRLEALAAAIAGGDLPRSKDDREIVLLLRQTIIPQRRRASAKRAALHWAHLRRRLTEAEIETLRQRVEDALQRSSHAKKYY
jgi:transcriptional regulator with XRE-family HTH domain